MDINTRVLLVAMALLFVVGMAIFLLWKLFEPKREGESRSLMESVIKPAAVMAGGVTFIGILMVFPQVLGWVIGGLVVFAVITFFRMPASEKRAMARAVEEPDPSSQWSTARLLLAVVIVFAAVFGLLAYFVPT